MSSSALGRGLLSHQPHLLASAQSRASPLWRLNFCHSQQATRLHRGSTGGAVVCGAAPVMEVVKKSDDLKRHYSSLATGEDLSDDYGDDTAGAPKDRRAGACGLMGGRYQLQPHVVIQRQPPEDCRHASSCSQWSPRRECGVGCSL